MIRRSRARVLWAARHWEKLAREEEDSALWEAQVLGPNHNIASNLKRADSFRRTAKSLYLEFWTGESHCYCCLSITCQKKAKAFV